MKNTIILIAVILGFSTMAAANNGPYIKNVEKVIVKHDGGKRLHEFVNCMLMLERYPDPDTAFNDKLPKIKKACDTLGYEAKRCARLEKWIGKKVWNCFNMRDFVQSLGVVHPQTKVSTPEIK